MQGNAGNTGKCWEWVQIARGIQGNARGCKGVGEMCQEITGGCQGNVWMWVQTAREMQWNARGMKWSWSKVLGKCRNEECWGMYGDGCNVPGEYRECRAMQENAGNAGNIRECMQSAKGMQGNPGECQGNIWECVQSAKRMQGNAKETYGSGCKVPGECQGNV